MLTDAKGIPAGSSEALAGLNCGRAEMQIEETKGLVWVSLFSRH